jgi:hypothetical protein
MPVVLMGVSAVMDKYEGRCDFFNDGLDFLDDIFDM